MVATMRGKAEANGVVTSDSAREAVMESKCILRLLCCGFVRIGILIFFVFNVFFDQCMMKYTGLGQHPDLATGAIRYGRQVRQRSNRRPEQTNDE